MKAVRREKFLQQNNSQKNSHALFCLTFCCLFNLAIASLNINAQPSSRENPLPLLTQELKGNIAPNVMMERFYSFTAGPGDVTFSLEVKSYEQWSNISVELSDRDAQTVIKFDASSGGDRKDTKLHLEQPQKITMRVYAPRNNQSGSFTLKIKGAITLNRGAAPAPPKSSPHVEAKQPEAPKPEEKSTDTASRSTTREKEIIKTTSSVEGVNEITTDKKVALVIGNSKYASAPLTNPENDAKAMAQALRESGFEVLQYSNLSKREFEESVRAFGSKINRGGVALFFFAGHGMQVKGVNYLLPVGANIQKETDIEFEAVDAGRIMSEIESAGSRLNIVILDACRNNPFVRGTRSAARGLAVMSAPSGTVVAYATGPGEVASDGDGKNGLYTQELLKNIREPNMKIEDVLKRTRIAVKDKTSGQQVPWENTSLDGDFYFRKK